MLRIAISILILMIVSMPASILFGRFIYAGQGEAAENNTPGRH